MHRLITSLFLCIFITNCASISTNTRTTTRDKISKVLNAHYISGLKKFSFNDDQRHKTLEAFVWYPVEESSAWISADSPYAWGRISENGAIKNPSVKKPLIIFSHGFGGSPDEYAWLIEPLIAAGYVVIATQHADFPGPQINHWNRPLDITFVLTRFLETPFARYINQDKIAFAGFSIGGMTGIALAGARMSNTDDVVPTKNHVKETLIIEDAKAALSTWDRERMKQDYRDTRIKAAFLMAPAWAWVFNKSDVQNIRLPVSIVAGDNDDVLVSETNGLWYANNIPGAEFRWIKGAGHFVFIGAPSCEGRAKIDPHKKLSFLYEDSQGANRHLVQEQTEKLAIDFFDRNL